MASTLEEINEKQKHLYSKYETSYSLEEFNEQRRRRSAKLQRFSCDKCGRYFDSKAHMKKHEHVHEHATRKTKFVKSLTAETLREEIDRRRQRGRPITCKICGKNFHTNARLVQHMSVHRSEMTFVCGICKKSFYKKDNLLTHMANHDNLSLSRDKTQVTRRCDSDLMGDAPENRNEAKSTLLQFSCNVCCESFASVFLLVEHTKLHADEASGHDSLHQQPEVMAQDETSFDGFISELELDAHMNQHSKTTKHAQKQFSNFVIRNHTRQAVRRSIRTHSGEIKDQPREAVKSSQKVHLEVKKDEPRHPVKSSTKVLKESSISMCQFGEHLLHYDVMSVGPSLTRSSQLGCHPGTENTESTDISISSSKIESSSEKDVFVKEIKPEKKYFFCKVCGKRFEDTDDVSLLVQHQKVHTNGTKFSCKVCHEDFALQSQFINHAKCHIVRHRCTLCSREFDSEADLDAHKKQHEIVEPDLMQFFCKVCRESFTSVSVFVEHTKLHNDEPLCNAIGKNGLGQKSEMMHLVKSHVDGCPCSICIKRFSSGSDLNAHVDQHSNLKPEEFSRNILCKTNHASQAVRSSTIVQSRVKEPSVPLCPTDCNEEGHFGDHLLHYDGKTVGPYLSRSSETGTHQLLPESSHMDNDISVTDIKAESSSEEDLLVKKQKTDDTENVSILFQDQQSHINKKLESELTDHAKCHIVTHWCTLCTIKFDSEAELDAHKKQHRKVNGLLMQVFCKVCEESFTSISLLVEHTKLHNDEQLCNAIGKNGLAQQSEIVDQVKTSVNGYDCSICKERFTSESKLDVHMDQHPKPKSASKQFPSGVISKTYQTRQAVKRNTEVHSGVRTNHTSQTVKNSTKVHPGLRKDHMRQAVESGTKSHSSVKESSKPVCHHDLTEGGQLGEHLLQYEVMSVGPPVGRQSQSGIGHMGSIDNSISSNKTKCTSEEDAFVKTSKTEKKYFFCKFCGKRFDDTDNVSLLVEHQKLHTNKKNFSCHVCHKKFSLQSEFIDHAVSHDKIQCYLCTRRFVSEAALNVHIKSHERVIAHNFDEHNIDAHEKIHEKVNSHELDTHTKSFEQVDSHLMQVFCKVCHEAFTSVSLLVEHTKLHNKKTSCSATGNNGLAQQSKIMDQTNTRVDGYLCCICKERFVSESDLGAHMDQHLKTKLAPKQLSGGVFSENNDGRQAVKSSTKVHSGVKKSANHIYLTDFNEEDQLCEDFLGYEVMSVGPTIVRSSGIHSLLTEPGPRRNNNKTESSQEKDVVVKEPNVEKKYFFCKVCGKRFDDTDNISLLVLHQKVHTNERRFSCHVCFKHFTLQSDLKDHAKCHVLLQSCTICQKVFDSEAELNTHHEEQHEEAKSVLIQFSCSVCHESFSSVALLVQHTKLHRDEASCSTSDKKCLAHESDVIDQSKAKVDRDFPIFNICKKRFDSHELDTHKKQPKVKTVSKQFCCDVCSKAFNTRQNLKRHMKVHSGISEYSSQICLTEFDEEAHLNEHVLQCEDISVGPPISRSSESGIHLLLAGIEEKKLTCYLCNESLTARNVAVCSLRSELYKFLSHRERTRRHLRNDIETTNTISIFADRDNDSIVMCKKCMFDVDVHCVMCEKEMKICDLRHHLGLHIGQIMV